MFSGMYHKDKRDTDVNIGSGQFGNLLVNTRSAENARGRFSSGAESLKPQSRSKGSERSRRESMADAVSEFFYSCSGNKNDDTKSAHTKSSKKQRHADTIKVKKLYTDDVDENQRLDD